MVILSNGCVKSLPGYQLAGTCRGAERRVALLKLFVAQTGEIYVNV